jgi:hypothetical protein
MDPNDLHHPSCLDDIVGSSGKTGIDDLVHRALKDKGLGISEASDNADQSGLKAAFRRLKACPRSESPQPR